MIVRDARLDEIFLSINLGWSVCCLILHSFKLINVHLLHYSKLTLSFEISLFIFLVRVIKINKGFWYMGRTYFCKLYDTFIRFKCFDGFTEFYFMIHHYSATSFNNDKNNDFNSEGHYDNWKLEYYTLYVVFP